MTTGSPTGSPPGAARLAALGALLVAEFGAVAVRHWWVELLGDFRDVSALAITLAVALAVFAGDRLKRAAERVAAGARPRFPWSLLALQLAAYGAFVAFTRHLVGRDYHLGEAGAAWTAVWVACGLGVLALWGLVVLPARGWRELMWRGRADIALALAVVVLAWGASRGTQRLWASLADDTLRAVELVLRVGAAELVVDRPARVIGTPGFRVHISPACSGYEGFGLVTAVVGCYLVLCRRELRFPAALVLLPLALAASWVLNVLRIAALVGIGAAGWPVIAVNGFHTQAGWLAFNAVALGVILLGRKVPALARRPDPQRAEGAPLNEPNPAAPYLVPLMVVVGTAMATAAATEGVDRLYGLRVLTGGLALWAFRRAYAVLAPGVSLAALACGLAVYGVWIGCEALIPPPPAETGNPLDLPATERALWFALRVIGAVLLVPVVEELAFRGYLMRRLQGDELGTDTRVRWNWFAVLASSVLFGALHPGRWVAGTLAGVAFAWCYTRRGRLFDAVVAHAVANAALAAHVVATGQWDLW